MALDELLKGLNAFQGGLQRLAIGNSITRAQGQIDQINEEDLTEQARMAELNRVSQQLSFGLGRAGAPAAQIQALTGFAPGVVDANTRAAIQSREKLFAANLAQDRELAKLQLIQDQIEQQKDDRQRENDLTRKAVGEFRDKEKVLFTALDGTESLAAQITATRANPQVGLAGIKRGLLRLYGDSRFSDKDVDTVTPNPSYAKAVKRFLFERGANRAMPDDINALEGMFKSLKILTGQQLGTAIKDYSRNADLYDSTPEKFEKRLKNRFSRFLARSPADTRSDVVLSGAKKSRFFKHFTPSGPPKIQLPFKAPFAD